MLLTGRSLIAGQHSLCSEVIEKLRYKDEKQLPSTHQAAVRGGKTPNPSKSNTKEAGKILQLITRRLLSSKSLGQTILPVRWDFSALYSLIS